MQNIGSLVGPFCVGHEAKMAEALSGLSRPGSKNEETYDEKVGNECTLCHNLKQELEIALQELSSARRIIQILRDDVNKIPDHRTVIQEKHQVDTVIHNIIGDKVIVRWLIQDSGYRNRVLLILKAIKYRQ